MAASLRWKSQPTSEGRREGSHWGQTTITLSQPSPAKKPVAQSPLPAHAADLDYGYDANGNVTSRVSPSGTTTYTYDPLDRVDLEAGPAGSRNHDFDAGENRVSDGAGTSVSVAPGSNRLATINGVSTEAEK